MQSLNEHLAKGNDPFAVAKIESSLSIRQSIESGIQLVKMGEHFGFEETLKLLTRLVENTANYFNINHNLKGTQLVQVCQAIIERFGHDNIEDIVLALKDARLGLCDKIYGRIDGEVILGWIEQYMDKKAQEIEKIHHQNKMKALDFVGFDISKFLEEKAIKKMTEPKQTCEMSDRIWLNWFEENKDYLSKAELKSIKVDLEANNVFRDGIYEETINWIDEHLK